jgi:hypothetical protein
MKKLVSIVLFLALLALVACDNSAPPPAPTRTDGSGSTSTSATTVTEPPEEQPITIEDYPLEDTTWILVQMIDSDGVDISEDVFELIGQTVFHFIEGDENAINVEIFRPETGIQTTALQYSYTISGRTLTILTPQESFETEIANRRFSYSSLDGAISVHERVNRSELAQVVVEVPLTVGDTAVIGNWELTLNSFRFTNRVQSNRTEWRADEGNMLLYVSITVENMDTRPQTFSPRFPTWVGDDIRANILYDNTFTFARVRVSGYRNCIDDRSTNPLTSTTGAVIFQVANRAANSDGLLELRFFNSNEEVNFVLR